MVVMNDLVTSVVVAVLGGGLVSGILNFVSARRQTSVAYSESVFKTLSQDYARVTSEVDALRAQLDEERKLRRNVESLLYEEQARTRQLERRVSQLEQG